MEVLVSTINSLTLIQLTSAETNSLMPAIEDKETASWRRGAGTIAKRVSVATAIGRPWRDARIACVRNRGCV